MSLLVGNDLREQQKINELELKINREKQKLDKKLTRQKILLGSFLIDAIEKDKVNGLKDYVAENLLSYLTRDNDKKLFVGLIENLGGMMITDTEMQVGDDLEQTQKRHNNEYN